MLAAGEGKKNAVPPVEEGRRSEFRNRRGAQVTAVLCVYGGGEPPGGAALFKLARRLSLGPPALNSRAAEARGASGPDRTNPSPTSLLLFPLPAVCIVPSHASFDIERLIYEY